jgi:hypothetical protein
MYAEEMCSASETLVLGGQLMDLTSSMSTSEVQFRARSLQVSQRHPRQKARYDLVGLGPNYSRACLACSQHLL